MAEDRKIGYTNPSVLIPEQTPPFVIIKITNGLESKTIVHLQEGVKKEAYGNILDQFEVKNYCDSIYFKNRNWKLGSPSVCKWRQSTLNQTLPISMQTFPLNKSGKSSKRMNIFSSLLVHSPHFAQFELVLLG